MRILKQFNARMNFIGLLLLVLFTLNCNTNKEPISFDYGKVEDNVYSNDYFGVMVELPSNWIVQSREQTEKIAEMGQEMIAGDDEKLNATIKASEINTANLLVVFRNELGAAVDFNPNFSLVAENLINTPSLKTGYDYLFHTRNLMKNGQFKFDYISEEFISEKIDGIEFYKMETRVRLMDIEVKQIYYSTAIKGFSFNIIISYNSDEEKEILISSLKTMKFNQ